MSHVPPPPPGRGEPAPAEPARPGEHGDQSTQQWVEQPDQQGQQGQQGQHAPQSQQSQQSQQGQQGQPGQPGQPQQWPQQPPQQAPQPPGQWAQPGQQQSPQPGQPSPWVQPGQQSGPPSGQQSPGQQWAQPGRPQSQQWSQQPGQPSQQWGQPGQTGQPWQPGEQGQPGQPWQQPGQPGQQWGPPAPARKKRSRGLLVGILTAVVLLALGATAYFVLVAGADPEALEPDVSSSTEATVGQLVVGNCLEDISGSGSVGDVSVVPCADDHTSQVIGSTTFTDGDFPGQPTLVAQTTAACTPDLVTSEDVPADELALVVWTPSEDSWSGGDRVGLCIATVDGSTTGSLIG